MGRPDMTYPSTTLASTTAKDRPVISRRNRRDWLAGYLFVLPDALGLLVFVGLPMLLALGIGFFEVDGFGSYKFVAFKNYARMWHDPLFWSALRVTVLYAVMLVPALYVSGLGLALLVQRGGRFATVIRAMFFAPQMVSLVVVALVWQILLVEKVGAIGRLAAAIGWGPVSFLGDPNLALITLVAVSVWFMMGFYMLIFLGGLQDIPGEYYEAAKIDGAGPVTSFWYITLPLLRPTSFFVLLVSIVMAAAGGQVFDLIYVMTNGGPVNATAALIVYIYKQAFQLGAFGYASAMASLLVVMLMLVTLLLFALTRGGRFDHD
jgi:multiple sugar transport system permease protein